MREEKLKQREKQNTQIQIAMENSQDENAKHFI